MILRPTGDQPDAPTSKPAMSCRVFGRQLENGAMSIAVGRPRARRPNLRAHYVPTERNGVIAGLFQGLGFTAMPTVAGGLANSWELETAGCRPADLHLPNGNPGPNASSTFSRARCAVANDRSRWP
jgi:hypothetical protein